MKIVVALELALGRRHQMALASLVLAGAVCCSRSESKPAPVGASASVPASAAALPSASATGLALPSVTSAPIAMGNLDGEIEVSRKRVDANDMTLFPRLIESLLMRAQYTGSDADLTEADERTKKDVAAHPKDGAAHQRRSGALASLPDF
ncbi:hypothetical protein BH09MYX1_BH09MYX1_44370 [soil metagenome]